MACSKTQIKKRSFCVGRFDKYISILRRVQTYKGFNQPDYTEKFESVLWIWAALETSTGFRSFNNVGTNRTDLQTSLAHTFYIRYTPECVISSEDFIDLDCILYKVVGVENVEEQNRFLKISAIKKGPNTLDANKA